MPTWHEHVERWKGCQRCPLGQQRDRICLARGSLPCTVLLVGEAPGASEDAIGQPFVGPAGLLLDQIVEHALPEGVSYLLTNLVACFPREAKSEGINEPEYAEIMACRPRLIELVNLAQPQLIVRVGKLATNYVPNKSWMQYVDIDHPAYILRMPLAQKQMATQRCIVRIRNAYEDVLQSPVQFKPWKVEDAPIKTRRQHLREDYDNRFTDDESDIPF